MRPRDDTLKSKMKKCIILSQPTWVEYFLKAFGTNARIHSQEIRTLKKLYSNTLFGILQKVLENIFKILEKKNCTAKI